ncbi:MAG: GNAT family N-acetyltransferase [Planctomycetaceae bacterium]
MNDELAIRGDESRDEEVPCLPGIAVNESIRLTDFEWSDRAACVAHLNESEEFHRFTLTIPYPYTEADFEWWMGRRIEERRGQPPSVSWAIRETRGTLIGACGLKAIVPGHQAEIGYWLARPYWGRGVTTAVVQALCGFAVRELELVRLTAHVVAENAASARVLEKNGFQCEGRLRKHVLKDGQFLDSRLFAWVR